MLGQREHRAARLVRVRDAEHSGVKALVEDGLERNGGALSYKPQSQCMATEKGVGTRQLHIRPHISYRMNHTYTEILGISHGLQILVCYARCFGAMKSRALARDFSSPKNCA